MRLLYQRGRWGVQTAFPRWSAGTINKCIYYRKLGIFKSNVTNPWFWFELRYCRRTPHVKSSAPLISPAPATTLKKNNKSATRIVTLIWPPIMYQRKFFFFIWHIFLNQN